jgi:putative transposase
VKYAFIDAEKARWPVDRLCHVLGVSRSGFYAWKARPLCRRQREDAPLAVRIAGVHRRSRGRYGSPRVHAELRAQGVRVGRKRVARLLREQGLRARPRRQVCRTTDSNHREPIAPNVLARQFQTDAPDRVWVGDVTYIPTAEGWLYLAVLLDLFSRRIVGWATSATNDRALARDALGMAVRGRRPRPGLVHHTDQRQPLRERGLPQRSLARGDASEHEPSRKLLGQCRRRELLQHPQDGAGGPRGLRHARRGDGLDRPVHRRDFYNARRRHSHLGYLCPIEFELTNQPAALAA